MESTQKKADLCNCGSGLPNWRCCGKARSRRSSPEGALELLCFLKNHQEHSYLQSELQRATHLTRWNTAAIVAWATAQAPPLVQSEMGEDGWRRFRADPAAIEAWMARIGSDAEPPRPNARTVTRAKSKAKRPRARGAA